MKANNRVQSANIVARSHSPNKLSNNDLSLLKEKYYIEFDDAIQEEVPKKLRINEKKKMRHLENL